MASHKAKVRISKFMCYVLRHKPEEVDVQMTSTGWVDSQSLLKAINDLTYVQIEFTFDDLCNIVSNDEKGRYEFNDDKSEIRACQGHSKEVDLGLNPVSPPDTLFHGTHKEVIDSILANGLNKQNRNHVHMSTDFEMMIQVGGRYGEPVVIEIDAQTMSQDGYDFFFSNNGVWLAEHVPAKYLKVSDKC